MLAVDESHRGLGIGTKLVENIVERMQQIGCNEVRLFKGEQKSSLY
jgi:ribosomal protein S18 acetylase RimI-like enzyme